MCQFDTRTVQHVPRPPQPVYEYAVAVRQEGASGNVELVLIKGTSLSVDPHWVKVLSDRDPVLIVPTSLVRRITRIEGGQ